MKKSACFRSRGFSLTEVLVAAAVLAIMVGLATPYLFGHREKAKLEAERDKVVAHLKIAQQKAIAAYKGYDYSVRFIPASNQYYLLQNGDQEGITYHLAENIQIEPVSPDFVKFFRLSGKAENPFSLTLVSKRFQGEILVSTEGLITTTKITNR